MLAFFKLVLLLILTSSCEALLSKSSSLIITHQRLQLQFLSQRATSPILETGITRLPIIITRTFSSSLFMASLSSEELLVPSRRLVLQGMELFQKGDIQGSIDKFDASVPQGAKAYLWQRGISYYYADEFAKGSQQFRDDVLRSPLDVEEIVWDIACLLRMDPTHQFPQPGMLSLPPGMIDRRPIMAIVYALFRGEAREQDLAEAGHNGSPGEEFYSLFYLGLFNEARGENSKAEQYMKAASKTKYARVVGSQDYMVDVANVHCQLRHWE